MGKEPLFADEMFKHELIARILRFGVVGGVVMLVFAGLNALFGLWLGKQGAFFAAYPPAVALHFCLSKWWTFACASTDFGRQVREYLAMVLVAFLVQWGIFSLLVAWLGLAGWLAAVAANAAQLIITFLAMQLRIFARPAGE